MTVGFKDILEARRAIQGNVVLTPFTYSTILSHITGSKVFLKFENHQFTASFKERGALVKILSLDAAQRKKGVVAVSAGNHAQAVAYHANRLKVPATIVMPRCTPHGKIEQTERFGAKVILEGANFDEAREFALGHAKNKTFIHPYNDPRVISGQGTIALEMLETEPNLEVLLIPVGGGGLISGIAVAAKNIQPKIKVVGIQARQPTIADGIAVKKPGPIPQRIMEKYVDDMILADEEAIEEAVLMLLKIEKTIVEGAGAVGLASLLVTKRFSKKKVGLVLSGGNLDLLTLSSILQRGLVKSGNLVRLKVDVPDTPGSLAKVCKIMGDQNASVVEVTHHRSFTTLPIQTAEVEFVLKTRGLHHVKSILEGLKQAGIKSKTI